MPSAKKSAKKNKQAKQVKKNAQAWLESTAAEFRSLLLSGRQEYAKGRAYIAVDLQKKALAFGSEKLARFDDDSLVKAHALVELSLATSAIQTDFATGDEWKQADEQCRDAVMGALHIYERRLAQGTLTKFRREECWLKGGEYRSPVPHTERLGPIDYLSCARFSTGFRESPTADTLQRLRKVVGFALAFKRSGCVIELEAGPCLQGQIDSKMIFGLQGLIQEHEAVVEGGVDPDEAKKRLFGEPSEDDDFVEVRHMGTRLGSMKLSDEKLVKDVEKKGLRQCEYTECPKGERQPRQFSSCSRCKWAAYCCVEHQRADWKRHKKECKTVSTKKRQAYEEQSKAKNALLYGQSKQLLVIIRCLHHYASICAEMKATETADAILVTNSVALSFKDVELGTLQLGVDQVGLVWSAIWSMKLVDREAMMRRFVKDLESNYSFPSKKKGGPDFGIVADWASHTVSGDFAVVGHTPKGSVLLHDKGTSDGGITAYLVVGITQSLESLLEAVQEPLPTYVCTALLPFKHHIVCQGTITPTMGTRNVGLEKAAAEYVNGDAKIDVLTTLY